MLRFLQCKGFLGCSSKEKTASYKISWLSIAEKVRFSFGICGAQIDAVAGLLPVSRLPMQILQMSVYSMFSGNTDASSAVSEVDHYVKIKVRLSSV